ncbi:HAD hydrolase-like protein [Neoactinobaculum massilliense]|uniref:HAD hydrolase-like protein n=1 Tax=Neoactinobaculum massilliense TaxID=2364794 RepID=UPI000F53BBF8|nr:HAD hydrolase-like protein [Neoactinobaculum massilliense]
MRPVLIDLDGTLHDSAAIVTEALDAMVRDKLGEVHPREYYLRFVGPPLTETMKTLGGPERVDELVAAYREYYGARMLRTQLFPGMRHMLEVLDAAGVPMAVATSKTLTFTHRILEHQGVAHHFRAICGAPDSARNSTKATVVADALRQLEAQGVDISSALMVGDRKHDAEGAAANGLPTVLVTWGAAPESEYELAWRTVNTAEELTELLLDFSRGKVEPVLV